MPIIDPFEIPSAEMVLYSNFSIKRYGKISRKLRTGLDLNLKEGANMYYTL